MTAQNSLQITAPRSARGLAAVVALALAGVALVVFAMVPAGWRLGLWYYDVSFALMRYAAYVALAATLTAIVALIGWPRLSLARRAMALVAFAVAVPVVYVPWHYARLAAATPPIHDVTTDPVNPPTF